MPKTKENPMETMPLSRLIIRIGIPLMLSLLISSLYNVVDSVYVSYVSEEALTAVSLAAPVQTLMAALGSGIAVGLNAVVSRALGEKDEEKAKKAASAAIFLAICAWLLIAVCGLLFIEPYFTWQAGGNERIAEYGADYLRICMLFSLGQMGQWVFDRLVIASGRSSLFLFTLSAASVTNLILDPIFIFGFFGIPAMGTAGAAIATVIGQSAGCVAGYFINCRYNREIPIAFTFRPDIESLRSILRVGIPTTVVQGVVSVVGICMNSLIIRFSTTAVAVYGICTKIQSVVTVGVHGLDNGLIPIVAYNYGAGREKRIIEAIRWTLIYAFLIYGLFLILLEGAPALVLRLFDASEDMMSIGVPALRIFALSYLASTVGMVLAAVFQGLGLGTYSMYLTMARQAIFPVGLVFLFIPFRKINLIWLAFLLAELLALPLGLALWKRAKRKVLADCHRYDRISSDIEIQTAKKIVKGAEG